MIKTAIVIAKNDPIFAYVGKDVLVNPFHQKFSSKTLERSQINTIYFRFC